MSANLSYEHIREELTCEFSKAMNRRYGELILERGLWETFLDLAMDDDPRVAFRASWSLDWAYFHDRKGAGTYARRVMEDFIAAGNQSVLREYSKMVHDMMLRGVLETSAGDRERLAEKCFDILISPEAKVAVKVWAMEILYLLMRDTGWIGEHLEEVLRRHTDSPDAAPAYQNRAAKVLRRMKG